MLKLRFLQTIAILTFISLIGLFVAYRGGILDSVISGSSHDVQTSPNGGPVTRAKTLKRDSANTTRFSSSKSAVIAESVPWQEADNKKDSIISFSKSVTLTGRDSWEKRDSAKKLRMSSSKSLILSERKSSYSIGASEKSRMSSSKSAVIFKPADSTKKKN